MALFAISGGPRPRKSRANWQARFRAIRRDLHAAKRLVGKAREKALIKICRDLEDATTNPPVAWHRDEGGCWWRVRDAKSRTYDAAERALERRVARVIGCCPGCLAHQPSDKRRR